jgi:hypothetical protein
MNILFITNKSFNKISGGSVLFSVLFKNINLKNISWFVCDDKVDTNNLLYKFKKVSYSYSFLFSDSFLNSLVRKFSFISFFYFPIKYKLLSKYIFYKRRKYFLNHDKLWIYVNQQSIPVAALIHKKLKINFHLSIQDNFSTHLRYNEYRYLAKDFEYLLVNATSIDFISEYSKNYYSKKYKITDKTLTFLISQTIDTIKPSLSDKIEQIGFAGNIWCGDTIVKFLNGLKLYNNNNKNKIKFIFYTSLNKNSSFFKDYSDFIDIRSFLPYADLVNELQKCDLLYLPMLFHGPSIEINTTSFPSKIITYLNCKVPILNHSPILSSTHHFVDKFDIGFSINSDNASDVCSSLESLFNNYNLEKRNVFSSNMCEVIKIFDTKKNVDNLQKILLDE